MSTVWMVDEPSPGDFLSASFLRESYGYSTDFRCDSCGRGARERLPLVMEWEAGPGWRLGDFSWPHFERPVVTGAVAEQLMGAVSGFTLGEVQIVNEARVKGRRGARARDIEGLDSSTTFHELWVTVELGLDRERSTGEPDPELSCEVCGVERWEMQGVETVEINWHGDMSETRCERVPGEGVFVDAALLDGPSFFFVKELSGWLFCNDEAKLVVESQGWSNIKFLEFGDTIESS